MPVNVFDGYRTSFGNKRAAVANITGPASYANPAGQTIFATMFGVRNIEHGFGGMSVSGTYLVRYKPKSASPNKQATLKWYVVATGAEVANAVNLSAESVNIFIIGG